jgi:hypothetical protein
MRIGAWLAAIGGITCIASPAGAQVDSRESRATLATVRGIYVAAEDMDSAAAAHGLTAAGLKADIEDRLRSAGIRVSSRDDFTSSLEVVQLYVAVNEFALTSHPGLFTYNCSTEVRQAVKLVRDPSVVLTTVTWRVEPTVGTVGSDNLYVSVRDKVRAQVDAFMQAYRLARQ